jgi:phospholipid transport system substrate-binding protein
VADAGGLRVSDLIVEGVSLRTTYRSDVASVIQSKGGKVTDLIDALREKTSSQ